MNRAAWMRVAICVVVGTIVYHHVRFGVGKSLPEGLLFALPVAIALDVALQWTGTFEMGGED